MITLIPHQPIDFTYKENEPCEILSSVCLQYQSTDSPQVQIKNSQGTAPLVTLSGDGIDEMVIPLSLYTISGDYYTYTLNFYGLGLESGCYTLCVYEISSSSGASLVTNSTFLSDISGWTSATGITLDIDSYTEDSVTISATGGTPSYTYSNGGDDYQVSATIAGLTPGTTYTFYAKDSNGVVGSIMFTLQDCGSFADSYAFDIKDIYAAEIKDCEAFDFT